MKNKETIKQLGIACKLQDKTITEWCATLQHPETGSGITRAAIYSAVYSGGPAWILDEVNAEIAKARGLFPEYYQRRAKMAAL